MATAFANARVLTGDGFWDDVAVLVENGVITAIVDADDTRVRDADVRDLDGDYLFPGFIDCQVNGGGDVLFNDAPTVETIRRIGEAHRQYGTTGFLPTLISDDLDVMRAAIAAVDTAIAEGVPGVLGIHLEGPYLAPARKGVHDATKFRVPDAREIDLISSLSNGKTVLTVAPERVPLETIRELTRRGVIVCAGHTAASYDETRAALKTGLRGFTHLFNAMPPLTSREPGVVGAALHEPECWCGLIVDGKHVHPAALRVALRCKRPDRFMLVTDAMPTVGSDRDFFMLQGRRVSVRDGVCVDDQGVLAGTAIDMATAVRNTVEMLDVPIEQAARMASTYPAQFLRLGDELGRIAPGYRANLTAVDSGLHVRATWIDGKPD
jgi:N-acetylglucosamine-6-phosphate deacetylase